jgi:hypothetical protein
MKEVDPQKTLFHLISFDGASNVQKAGRLINQHFPCCTVILSNEQIVSLVFENTFELRPMKKMCSFCKKVRIFSHVSLDNFVTDICYLVAALRLETFLDQTCRAYTDGSRCH